MFTIKTKRLLLRDLIPEDQTLFLELMKDPNTRYYMGDFIKADIKTEAKAWVKEKMEYNSETPRHSYNLAIKFHGETIGWTGIGEAEEEEKKDLE